MAEYAVDFDLQITAINSAVAPVLSTYTSAMGAFAQYTGTTYNTGNTPQWIRSVRVRLGVRSREADRSVNIANGAGSGLFRFGIGGSGNETFARVRTFQADVALHNQADILWQ